MTMLAHAHERIGVNQLGQPTIHISETGPSTIHVTERVTETLGQDGALHPTTVTETVTVDVNAGGTQVETGGLARAGAAKLPPPPTWLDEDGACERPTWEQPRPHVLPHSVSEPPKLDIGRAPATTTQTCRTYRTPSTPRSDKVGVPSRARSRPRTPRRELFTYGFPVPAVPTVPYAPMLPRRSESVPVLPSPQVVMHAWTPSKPTPAITPRSMMETHASQHCRAEVDASRAAVESCRMLAEAGKAAAIRCATEAAHEAQQRAYNEMRGRHSGLELENAALRAEIGRLKSDGGFHGEKLAASELRVERLALERDEALARLGDVEEMRGRLAAIESHRDQLIADNSHLKGTCSTHEQSLGNLRLEVQSVRRLQGELEALKGEKESILLQERQRAEAELDVLRRRVGALEAERDQLSQDASHHKNRFGQSEQNAISLRAAMEEERSNVRRLQRELEQAKSDHDTRTSHENTKWNAEIEGVRRQLALVHAERDLARADVAQIETLRKRLTAVEGERDRLKSDASHLKSAIDQREQTVTSLRSSLEEERNSTRLLQRELGTVKAERDSGAMRGRERDGAQLAELEVLRRERDSLSSQLTPLRAERDQLSSDLGHLKNAMAQREQTIANLRQSVEEERRSIRLLQTEIDAAKKELISMGRSSLPQMQKMVSVDLTDDQDLIKSRQVSVDLTEEQDVHMGRARARADFGQTRLSRTRLSGY